MPAWIARDFFKRDPVICARELIGCELVWEDCAGMIVETEAYAASGDDACHTFTRPSSRKFVETHVPGAAYVYFNYGVHWMLNVLVKGGARDGFVLLRALQPTGGTDKMTLRRTAGRVRKPGAPAIRIEQLCSGPGRLAQALGLTGADHGRDLCRGSSVGFRPTVSAPPVDADVRVGISRAADFPWRFLWRESAFVSVKIHGAGTKRCAAAAPPVSRKRKSQPG